MMPLLSAVSSSAKQLFLLLRCIAFSQKASVQVLPSGIRFSVEEARVIQGIAFLEKSLFTTYTFDTALVGGATGQDDAGEGEVPASFEISLNALLETLQIFGFSDPSKDRYASRDGGYSSGIGAATNNANAFSSAVLGVSNICRLSYAGTGEPLCIDLEENNVMTSCELATYDPESHLIETDGDEDSDIPFDRESLVVKVIMQSAHLFDAIQELSSASPERVSINASPTAPHFVLYAAGPLGSANVEFSKDPTLLETFQIASASVTNTYKFSLLRAATRAMGIAAKVSIRIDVQGVLSLQFMIANEDGTSVSFVDFRVVPYTSEDADFEDDEAADSAHDSAAEDI